MSPRSTLAAVLALAGKDLLLLSRDRAALFFAFGWPVAMALLFGLVFSGGAGRSSRIPLALADEDGSPAAAALLARLAASDALAVERLPRGEAERLVRAGKKTAALVVPAGWGSAGSAGRTAPRLVLAVDPSRTAEAAMLEGLVVGAALSAADAPSPPAPATGGLDPRPALAMEGGAPQRWQPPALERHDLRAERKGPASPYEVTFPQGILWGVIGCALGFGLSLATERARGTLVRLRASPLSDGHVLAGKALACLAAIAAVEAALLGLGATFFGLRPASWALLALAAAAVAACFVGLMVLVSVLGRTEEAASGLGWAIMMPLALFGGAMVPLFVMPEWMQAVGALSPVKWGILALEGALWRGFGARQLLGPCAALLGIGATAFALGAARFRRLAG